MSWEGHAKPAITLVDPGDKFVFLPLLYEFATDQAELAEVAAPYTEIFANTPIKFIQDKAQTVDFQDRKVILQNSGAVDYDFLVMAVGSVPATARIPGATENALPFCTLEDAYELKKRILDLLASDKKEVQVAIIGGSYSGVELACSLVDYFGRTRSKVTLLDRGSDLLKTSLPGNRLKAEAALKKGHVKTITNAQVLKVEESGAVVFTTDVSGAETTLQSDLTVLTAGNKMGELVEDLNLQKDPSGRILVNSVLSAKGFPNVFALGDNAAVEGQNVFPNTQVVIQESDYVAWNIWATLTNRKKLAFRYQSLGEMMTLGSGQATISAFGFTVDGHIGALARRVVFIARQPTTSQLFKAGQSFLQSFRPKITLK